MEYKDVGECEDKTTKAIIVSLSRIPLGPVIKFLNAVCGGDFLCVELVACKNVWLTCDMLHVICNILICNL